MADLGAIATTTPVALHNNVVLAGAAVSATTCTTAQTLVTQPLGALSYTAAVTTIATNSPKTNSRILPVWALDYRSYFFNNAPTNLLPRSGIPITGTISGQVQEAGTPVPGRLVLLYYKPNGKLISSTKSDASGNYTFTGLDPGSPLYIVMSTNNLPLQYDAVVHDNISAI